ncbi:MAG: SIR2 family protein [bacterium]|nr:SIR2 family protein [bacterium]
MSKNVEIREDILKIFQDCISRVPVIVIGSGVSCKYDIGGMPELAKYLVDNIVCSDSKDKKQWNLLKEKLQEGKDLESALNMVPVSSSLEKKIIFNTQKMVLGRDGDILKKVILGNIKFSISELLIHLVRTTNKLITIVTTNYDRLAEYATELSGLNYNVGYSQGYYRTFRGFDVNPRYFQNPIIEILKVHGSIDWYLTSSDESVSLPDKIEHPFDWRPLMVTPGVGKYQHTHNEPFRSIISKSDEAFNKAPSILCIGYGFNDTHIHPKLISRSKAKKIPIVILAKKLSDKAKSFIENSQNDKLIGIEQSDTGALLYLTDKSKISINDNIWDIDCFLKYVI